MSQQRRILVISPCHNEAGRVGQVVGAIREILPQADVVVIDDDSTDPTATEARQAGAVVLRHVVNLGYGAALETGYWYALKHQYDVVLQIDGDGQHPAEELPKLLVPIERGEADIVIGSRYLNTQTRYRSSWLRRLGQRLFGLCVFLVTRRRFTDPTSGFQALGRRAIRLFSSESFPYDYPDADVLLMTHLAGLRVTEVAVRMLPREDGRSMHGGWSVFYYVMKMFLSMFVVLLNYRKWRRLGSDAGDAHPPGMGLVDHRRLAADADHPAGS